MAVHNLDGLSEVARSLILEKMEDMKHIFPGFDYHYDSDCLAGKENGLDYLRGVNAESTNLIDAFMLGAEAGEAMANLAIAQELLQKSSDAFSNAEKAAEALIGKLDNKL